MKRLFSVMIIGAFFSTFLIIGCGGGGGGDAPSMFLGYPPEILRVVLTDENFNAKNVFEIGDTANFLVEASDNDKNMTELIVEQ